MHMKDFNKLDIAGISNLGIGFETEEEMKNFATIIKEEMLAQLEKEGKSGIPVGKAERADCQPGNVYFSEK